MFTTEIPKKTRQDLVILGISIPLAWYVLSHYDIFESLFNFSRAHEEIQLDELFTLLIVAGVLGYIFTWRRILELSKEIQLRKNAQRQAIHLAYHDQLTGLLNRRALADRFEGTCALEGERAVIALMDLNSFKHVNDIYGHATGDALLQHVATALTHEFPDPESVYRLSGDEFVVVLISAESESEIQHRLEKAMQAIAQDMTLGDIRISGSATFGVALFPDHGGELSTLLRRADIALYQAKKTCQACVRFYTPALDGHVEEQSHIEQAIRNGLQENRFRPYFQPLIELSSGKINGFEVLARLTDPELGEISPVKFIAVAERTGLIQSISESILRQAAAIAVQSLPADTYIAFNLSPLQLRDPMLVDKILLILSEAGLPCPRLELEITESVLIDSSVDATQIFERLHQNGISVVIDDFGTGYSSLSRLSRFKFDKIKIDRAFISQLGIDERNERIVDAMLGLCQGLNSAVLAEGVEDDTQDQWLRDKGVDMAQGFLYSHPLPIEALEPILRAHQQNATAPKPEAPPPQ